MTATATKKKAKPVKPGTPSTAKAGHPAYPPALYTAVAELESKMVSRGQDEVRDMVADGREVQRILDDKAAYGGPTFAALADLFTVGRDLLRPSYVLATRYTDGELDQLLTLENPETKAKLHRSHVIALTRVKDKTKAFKLAEETVERGWTRRELAARIIKVAGGKSSAGGRQFKVPDSLDELFTQVADKSENWVRQDLKAWHAKGGLHDLLRVALVGPGLTTADEEAMKRAEAALDELSLRLSTMQAELAQARRRLAAGLVFDGATAKGKNAHADD